MQCVCVDKRYEVYILQLLIAINCSSRYIYIIEL